MKIKQRQCSIRTTIELKTVNSLDWSLHKNSSATAAMAERGRKANLNLKLQISNSVKPAENFLRGTPHLHGRYPFSVCGSGLHLILSVSIGLGVYPQNT